MEVVLDAIGSCRYHEPRLHFPCHAMCGIACKMLYTKHMVVEMVSC